MKRPTTTVITSTAPAAYPTGFGVRATPPVPKAAQARHSRNSRSPVWISDQSPLFVVSPELTSGA